MRKSQGWYFLMILAVIGLLLLGADAASARVGGGHSYSGGGSHFGGGSYGGSSGGSRGSFYHSHGQTVHSDYTGMDASNYSGLLLMIISNPLDFIMIMFPMIAGSYIVYTIKSWDSRRVRTTRYYDASFMRAEPQAGDGNSTATTCVSLLQPQTYSAGVLSINREVVLVRRLREVDASFSLPLFLDFVGHLYCRVKTKEPHKLESAACYLAPELRQRLINKAQMDGITDISEVIVGSISITKFNVTTKYQRLVVSMETNFTETREGEKIPLFCVEEWTFSRLANVISQGPEEITKFACPSCGSPAALNSDSTCRYCGKQVLDGSYAWVLVNARTLDRTRRRPISCDNGLERGTNFPTIINQQFEANRKAFTIRHPDFVWAQFEARVCASFLALQQAWNEGKWESARPYETDHLFTTHLYWLKNYAEQGLRNRIEDVQIQRVTPVKLETDAYYDSLTVRIWASCKDWTVRLRDNAVVSGSATATRIFTEYWTFIRRSDYQPRGEGQGNPSVCPSCGAPLRVAMSGVCEYCDTLITNGNFDWTLTRIEQDESYRG